MRLLPLTVILGAVALAAMLLGIHLDAVMPEPGYPTYAPSWGAALLDLVPFGLFFGGMVAGFGAVLGLLALGFNASRNAFCDRTGQGAGSERV